MEARAGVAEALLASAESTEVGSGLGDDVVKQLEDDLARGLVATRVSDRSQTRRNSSKTPEGETLTPEVRQHDARGFQACLYACFERQGSLPTPPEQGDDWRARNPAKNGVRAVGTAFRALGAILRASNAVLRALGVYFDVKMILN